VYQEDLDDVERRLVEALRELESANQTNAMVCARVCAIRAVRIDCVRTMMLRGRPTLFVALPTHLAYECLSYMNHHDLQHIYVKHMPDSSTMMFFSSSRTSSAWSKALRPLTRPMKTKSSRS
jgi:hypothetical protein